jgi:vacuolar-type H+-ATPase subunit I/STV1
MKEYTLHVFRRLDRRGTTGFDKTEMQAEAEEEETEDEEEVVEEDEREDNVEDEEDEEEEKKEEESEVAMVVGRGGIDIVPRKLWRADVGWCGCRLDGSGGRDMC